MDYYYVVFLSRFIVLIKICKDIFIRFEWYSDYFSLPFLFLDYNRYLKALADTGERFLYKENHALDAWFSEAYGDE